MIETIFLALILLGSVGLGHRVLGWLGIVHANPFERFAFAAGLGLGCLMVTLLGLGLAGVMTRAAIWLVTGAGILWGTYTLLRRGSLRVGLSLLQMPRSPVHRSLALLALVSLGLCGMRALAPPHGATDPLAYQLALPKIYLQNARLTFEATITGALYPQYMNLLYAAGIALRGGVLAQLIHWLTGVLCTVGLVGFCSRYFTPGAGLWAAAVFATMPIVVVFGPQGYIDVGLCFFQFLAFWALLLWVERPSRNHLLLAALLAGLAAGTKHQGLATLAVGVPFVLGLSWRRGTWSGAAANAALYAGCALLLVAPWYARALYFAGNPVWPLANDVFHGLPFGSAPVILSGDTGGASGALDLLLPSFAWLGRHWQSMSPWSWAFLEGGWQKATGIYYVALLPGALLGWREPRVRWLLGFCLLYYILLVRALHMNPRYGLVLFAFAAVACGYAADRFSRLSWRPAAIGFSAFFCATLCVNLAWEYFLFAPTRDVVVGTESRDQFLRRSEYNYQVLMHANQTLPEGSRVLLQGMVRGYYCDVPYLWDHPHQSLIDYSRYDTPEGLLQRFEELGITHVVRVINVSPSRVDLGYPQYFTDPLHEAFRRKYLRLIYRDDACVLFAVAAPR